MECVYNYVQEDAEIINGNNDRNDGCCLIPNTVKAFRNLPFP